MIRLNSSIRLAVALSLIVMASAVHSDAVSSITADQQSLLGARQAPAYSPYVGRATPTRVLWGDTHLHTDLSLDARAFGVTLGPADAYRFARGEEVTSSHGERIRLSRPLDFLVVSDHSDGLGAMKQIIAGDPGLLRDPTIRSWHDRLSQGGDVSLGATMEVIASFTSGTIPEPLLNPTFTRTIWESYLKIAEEYNDPGHFSTIIGYEWTSTEGGNNLHRNVLYRGGADEARQVLPYTTSESFNPEDLWKWMENFENRTGGQVLAIAHNGNLSNGVMFPVEKNPATGRALGGDYAKRRIRWEPVYEITQIKGDGESHPYLSPEDDFAGYEPLWDRANLGPVPKTKDMLQYEYAREALKNGLKIEAKTGTNPYKFGVIGSTDSHTGLTTAEEENFFGKHSGVEPGAQRWEHLVGHFGNNRVFGWEMLSSGYAAVWATDNTREAIFDAIKRREVYATTGPRMTVWFFGGWDYQQADLLDRTPAQTGYAKGVAMGGNLGHGSKGQAPRFLIAALKDPYRGNLDRIQVVKGWLDAKGKTQEKVYNVAWSAQEKRQIDSTGRLPAVGNTVDVVNASWANSIGATELYTVWEDPEFDAAQRAFYYARVLEIPTPRWTAYDAKRYGVTMADTVPMVTQERAYTSPIWYTP